MELLDAFKRRETVVVKIELGDVWEVNRTDVESVNTLIVEREKGRGGGRGGDFF